MGIIKRIRSFFSRKRNEEDQTKYFLKEDLDIESFVNYRSPVERQNFVSDSCTQIVEAVEKIDKLKLEYQRITSYLTDIQKIDLIQPESRNELDMIASSIVSLTKERTDYQKKAKKLSNKQYRLMKEHEDLIPDTIKKLKISENRSTIIKRDMEHLEGEKGSLFYEKENIGSKRKYLNWLGKVTCVWVIALMIVLFVIGKTQNIDIQIPFLITVFIAFIFATYIFVSVNNDKKRLNITILKIQKAIRLLNKVKIKYVNNQNELEYIYKKYWIHNSTELEYNWRQYKKEKEEEIKYRKNTSELDTYYKELIRILEENDVVNPDIWLYQAGAIIDPKEMVEVRHDLNVRRQKIRENLEFNNDIKENGIQKIQKLISIMPESKEEVNEYLRKYGVSI
jgi:hypothetical protein